MSTEEPKWDVFISHSWEDKDSFVRPLATALVARGLKVWYDEFTIKLSDPLPLSIEEGVTKSHFGIVVLSPSYFTSKGALHELNAFLGREMAGQKVIVPICYQITYEEVRTHSASLAAITGIRTTGDVDLAVQGIMQKVKSANDASRTISPVVIDRSKLLRLLEKKFDLNSLIRLCFYLDVKHENIKGHDTLQGLAMGLILYMERYNRFSEIQNTIQEERPDFFI